MFRRKYLKAIGAGTIAAGVGVTASSAQTGTDLVNPGFEDAFRGWTIGRDLPTGVDGGVPVGSGAGITDRYASAGNLSLALYIDGSHDDGTIWAQQPVDLSAASVLEVDFWSPQQDNTHASLATYTGPLPDRGYLRYEDFTIEPERHDGWQTLQFPVEASGEGVVAAGMDIHWETDVTRYIDEVRLR